MAKERLQKIIARAGIASRRAAEKLVAEGRVSVNGQVVDRLGSQADPETDHIRVDGKRIEPPKGAHSYYLAFKPTRMITALSDPAERPTIADLLRHARIRRRVFPVGRLDWDADGLLLLTDDGELAHRVAHPSSHLPKTYRVKVKGCPDGAALDRVRRGVTIERGVRSLPARVDLVTPGASNSWLVVELVEGRQNQIKKMFERIGHPVRKIRRTKIGPLSLGKMRVGEIRPMTERELARLRRALDQRADGGSSSTSRRGTARRDRADGRRRASEKGPRRRRRRSPET